MGESERRRRVPAGVLVAAALCAVLVFALVRTQRLPEGPVPIAWDRETCALCGMHVSEPAFAAQLQTTDGQVLSFDDPGDLFAYLDDKSPPVHALWFHHVRDDRWMSSDEVAFERVPHTPMGHGLGAVDAGTPGALTLDEARRLVREQQRVRGAR